jgi:hypothetical protein
MKWMMGGHDMRGIDAAGPTSHKHLLEAEQQKS